MTTTRPVLRFEDQDSQALFGTTYDAALENLLGINTVPYGEIHARSGLMDPAVGMVRAGGGYEQPWTRDATINSWNATSLLAPALAANTLWAVVEKDAAGKLQVQQDSQQWDQVVWTVGAWHHYLVTGDLEFLRTAFEVVTNTLELREQAAVFGFDARRGLFTGPSFFNDGVSGFAAPMPADGEVRGSESTSYADVVSSVYLSTNALYYAAYTYAAEMAEKLGLPGDNASDKAKAIKQAVNKHFWNPRAGTYNYELRADGTPGAYQEGTGLAFTLLFGIADDAQAGQLISAAHRMTWGMPDTYPHWDRYSSAEPGRHNAIVWPLVQGLWAKALAEHGDQEGFATETTLLAELVRDSGGFWEIYNGDTGAVDGGYQAGYGVLKHHWDSQPDQTWSATAFIDMMHSGLVGLRFDDAGLTFAPTLPAWGDVTLAGLRYRNAHLTVNLHGSGTTIRTFELDGRPTQNHGVPTSLHGGHTIDITLGD